jgi:ParB-like chromosome segregation protein Spo0J
MYLLLDGHMRIQAMRELGATEVNCIVSIDDEGFTYNKRVNRLATVQQHRMVVRAQARETR